MLHFDAGLKDKWYEHAARHENRCSLLTCDPKVLITDDPAGWNAIGAPDVEAVILVHPREQAFEAAADYFAKLDLAGISGHITSSYPSGTLNRLFHSDPVFTSATDHHRAVSNRLNIVRKSLESVIQNFCQLTCHDYNRAEFSEIMFGTAPGKPLKTDSTPHVDSNVVVNAYSPISGKTLRWTDQSLTSGRTKARYIQPPNSSILFAGTTFQPVTLSRLGADAEGFEHHGAGPERDSNRLSYSYALRRFVY